MLDLRRTDLGFENFSQRAFKRFPIFGVGHDDEFSSRTERIGQVVTATPEGRDDKQERQQASGHGTRRAKKWPVATAVGHLH